MKKYFFLPIFILYGYCSLEANNNKDSSAIFSLPRFKFGIYVMPHIVNSNDPEFPKHTRDNTKTLGIGLTYGSQVEYKMTDRLALRLSIFISQEKGFYQLFSDDPHLPFNTAIPGHSYFLKINESHLQLPIEFKYSFIKDSKKTKLKPYLIAGFSFGKTFKQEKSYVNNGGTKEIDHVENDYTFMKGPNRIVLTLGLNYCPNEKFNVFFEPLFYKTGSYCSFHVRELGTKQFNYWGLGMGLNYIFK